ncbi:Fc.00g036040.m01.CDS01 [Cosmosporella sp. VM-42]
MLALNSPESDGLKSRATQDCRATAGLSPSPKSGAKRKREPLAPLLCPPQPRSEPESPLKIASDVASSTVQPEQPPSPKKLKPSSQPAVQYRIPEPLSINAIMREHRGTRLYIKPLYWTSTHLNLLDCHFEQKKAEEHSSSLTRKQVTPKSSTEDHPNPEFQSEDRLDAVKVATQNLEYRSTHPATQTLAVRGLLEAFGCSSLRCQGHPAIMFHFEDRPVSKLKVDWLFSHPHYGPLCAFIAYLNLCNMPRRRKESLGLSSRLAPRNLPGFRVKKKKVLKIKPSVELEDSYIVGVLISLAQEQRRWLELREAEETEQPTSVGESESSLVTAISTTGSTETPTIEVVDKEPSESLPFKVYLVTTTSRNGLNAVHLYNADISTEFLDKFSNPYGYSKANPLVIEYQPLPLRDPEAVSRILEKHVVLQGVTKPANP